MAETSMPPARTGADAFPTQGADGGAQGAQELCNGYDDDLDGQVDEGCSCTIGATQACFPGRPGDLAGGSCAKGQQTCQGSGEFGAWGPCQGAVGPQPEICGDGIDQDCDGSDQACPKTCSPELCGDGLDNDCDELFDCDDPDCASSSQCLTQKCQGGSVYIDDLWYCLGACAGGGVGVATTQSYAAVTASQCAQHYGAGGTLTANCAGTFTVCAVLKNTATKAVCRESCVQVIVAADNATVPLPKFPGFFECNACSKNAAAQGGHTCLRVKGKTVYGVDVNKEVHCGWYFAGSSGSGGGGGGKGPEPGGGSW